MLSPPDRDQVFSYPVKRSERQSLLLAGGYWFSKVVNYEQRFVSLLYYRRNALEYGLMVSPLAQLAPERYSVAIRPPSVLKLLAEK